MSWHFSRALVEEYSAGISLDGGASALSKLSRFPHVFSSSARMMDFCRRSPSGMMCEHLTESHGEELLTSYLEASRARTLAAPEAQAGRG